nr:MAG TPA: hypothetical protein [Caudoviricetes sp.]
MYKITVYLLLFSASVSLAQELPKVSPQTPPINSASNEVQSPSSAPASSEATPSNARSQEAQSPGALPLNLGGLTQVDNNALLSVLGNQNNLVDMSGKKIDDVQQKLVRARFEKYLNSPPSTSKEDLSYNQLLVDISQRLAGKGGGSDSERTLDAWRLLFKAEDYPMDDQLCRTIADKVVNFWQTTRKIEKLAIQNEALEKDRARKESGMRNIASMDRQEFIQMMRGKDATPPPTRDYELDPIKKRLQETEAKLRENKSYEAASRVNQKLDFQSLIVQFFLQRRYYHAMIANDFYRYLFAAEDGKIEGIDSLKGQVFGGVDIKLTTSTIDALCKEAINDTDNAVKAAEYLISRGEIHSATQRMLEAFFLGENLASVKTFPMDSKREIMRYLRDTDKLINAVKVKHVERAEEILKEIQSYVKDFDSGQIEAFIQTSRQLSDLALQKALVAAQTRNQPAVETALQDAVNFWPTNPKIQEFLKTMIGKVDLKDVAVTDFDRLYAQKDFRGIFNDRFRFAAALAADSSRNKTFLEIMKRMEIIETSIGQAKELSRLKNNFAAWEIVEKVHRQFPEDSELNRIRADLTIRVSAFAAAMAKAEEALESGDKWTALLAYLKAKDIYPMSSIADSEISKLANQILDK